MATVQIVVSTWELIFLVPSEHKYITRMANLVFSHSQLFKACGRIILPTEGQVSGFPENNLHGGEDSETTHDMATESATFVITQTDVQVRPTFTYRPGHGQHLKVLLECLNLIREIN